MGGAGTDGRGWRETGAEKGKGTGGETGPVHVVRSNQLDENVANDVRRVGSDGGRRVEKVVDGRAVDKVQRVGAEVGRYAGEPRVRADVGAGEMEQQQIGGDYEKKGRGCRVWMAV